MASDAHLDYPLWFLIYNLTFKSNIYLSRWVLVLIDGCLYIYSELDLESPARGADDSDGDDDCEDHYEDDDDDNDEIDDDDDDHHHDQE